MSFVRTCAVVFKPDAPAAEPIRVLVTQVEVLGHQRSLDPWVSQLRRDGARGMVFLMDLEANEIVARRDVMPKHQRPADEPHFQNWLGSDSGQGSTPAARTDSRSSPTP